MKGRGVISLFIVFLFLIVSVSGAKYDVISNADQWYVCNATGDAPILGDIDSANYVPEYSTFPSKYDNGEVSCIETMNDLFAEELSQAGFEEFTECDEDLERITYCCDEPYLVPYSQIANSCECYFDDETQTITQDMYCDANPYFCPELNPDTLTAVDLISKSLCGPTLECLSAPDLDPTKPCSQLTGEPDRLIDEENEVCSNGILIYSIEDGQPPIPQKQCCYGEDAQTITFDPSQDCVEMGGTICYDSLDMCTGNMPEGTNCCFGGQCVTPYVSYMSPVAQNTSFICYKEDGNNYFAECCFEGKCENEFGVGSLSRLSVGVGNALHQVDRYDTYDGTFWYDYVKIKTNNDYSLDDPYISFGTFKSNMHDWSGFDTFEFDFATNYDMFPSYLKLETGNDEIEIIDVTNNISQLSTNGFSDLRWHHIVVDLSNINEDISNITSIRIGVNQTYLQASMESSGVPAQYAVDNLILRDFDDSDNDGHSETYYCTGGFGTWVEDLDPLPGTDMTDVGSYGPYKYACEAQASFDWTGSNCCGDDTRFNYGEYFNDSYHGCYNGTTIYNDWTLANATNIYSEVNRGLLFYNESFWVCGQDNLDYFSIINKSYDGVTSLADNPLVTEDNLVTYFQDVGSWYCDPDGWVYLENANRLRILSATLKDLAGDDYSLHCGPLDDVMNIPKSYYLGENEEAVEPEEGCVLNNGSNILVGLPVKKAEIDNFLAYDFGYFHPYRNIDVPVCSDFDDFTNESFYQPCDVNDNYLKMYYNEPFGILIFTFSEEGEGGVFGFFINMWESIVKFFENLFDIEGAPDTIIIPKAPEEASFEELYINKLQDKMIYGLRENNTIIVIYNNTDTDVEFLKDLTEIWFNSTYPDQEDDFNIEYFEQGPEKSIRVNGTGVYDFNWTYLTSNLKLS